jgi:hypothetical protein
MSENDAVELPLIDVEDEVQQFKAVPVALSEEGEKRFLSLQESYRSADHHEWNMREIKKLDAQNAHIQKTNRFNLVNSVVHFAGLAALILVVVSQL